MARKVRIAKPALVEILWTDARSYYERIPWGDVTERCALSQQHTVGYLCHQDATRTIVAHTYDAGSEAQEGADAVDVMVIPTGWIVSLRDVNKRRARARLHVGAKSESVTV